MTYFDPKIYNENHLKKEDKEIINLLDNVLFPSVLDKGNVDEYVCHYVDLGSKPMRKLYKSIIKGYVKHQRFLYDCFKTQLMASMMEAYTDEELEELLKDVVEPDENIYDVKWVKFKDETPPEEVPTSKLDEDEHIRLAARQLREGEEDW